MKKNLAILVLVSIILLLLVSNTISYKRSNNMDTLELPTDTSIAKNSVSMTNDEIITVYQQLSRLGITNFNLGKSGFYSDRIQQNILPPEIMPGVYFQPEEYLSIDVDYTSGSVDMYSNMETFSLPYGLLDFFGYVDYYTNSDLKEFPGYSITTCEEAEVDFDYPGCYTLIYPADLNYNYDFSFMINFYDLLQILQTTLNPDHTSMQLYNYLNVYVPLDSIYYNQLNEFGVLEPVEGEDYALLLSPTSEEINNDYDSNFINNLNEILPEKFEISRIFDGYLYYYSFAYDGTEYQLRYGAYEYNQLKEYLSGSYTLPDVDFEEEGSNNTEYCPYNYEYNPVMSECRSAVSV